MNKLFLSLILGLFFVASVSAVSIFPFPDNPFGTTSSSTASIGYNWSCPEGQCLTQFSWDNVNYTLPTDGDPSLVLSLQMNNLSSLGEWANETGCLVVDTSQYSNNGSCVGGTNLSWTNQGSPNSVIGGAFNFSGNVSSIQVANSNSLNLSTNNFTISVWIKTSQTGVTTGSIISKRANAYEEGFWLHTKNGLVSFTIEQPDNAYSELLSNKVVNDNQWHNIVAIKKPTVIEIYIDGNLDNSKTHTITDSLYTSAILYIGGYIYSTDEHYYQGLIDDISLFNRSMTSNEVKELYMTSHTQYNLQNWSIIINQSLNAVLNSSQTSYNFPYYICSSNSTGENCTSQKTITQTIPNKVLIANFTNSIGNIRPDFYGANTQGNFLAGDGLTYGTKKGSNFLDVTEYRNAWVNTNMKYIRADMGLNYLYSNSSDGSVNFTGGTSNYTTMQIETVKWAYQNGYKVLFIADYMPSWLADNSSGKCTNLVRCPANNYTQWNNIVLDFLNRVTSNGLYNSTIEVEVWNEPDLNLFWMGGLNSGSMEGALNYSILYNNTYNIIKGYYPNMAVGGGAFA